MLYIRLYAVIYNNFKLTFVLKIVCTLYGTYIKTYYLWYMFERQTNSDETNKTMKITKKQIKENTLSTELKSNGSFERLFKHYFELKVDSSEGKPFHKITFSLSNEEIIITTYWNRLNDEPKYERLHTYEGKAGFVNKVYDYISAL